MVLFNSARACLVLATLSLALARRSYDGYQVLRFVPQNVEQIQLLSDWAHSRLAANTVEWWEHCTVPREECDLLVAPGENAVARGFAADHGIPASVFVEDVALAMLEEQEPPASLLLESGGCTRRYEDFNATEAWIRGFANDFAHFGVTLQEIGRSFEGRPLLTLHLETAAPAPDGAVRGQKKAVILDSAIHAREWITTATLREVLHRLTTHYVASAAPGAAAAATTDPEKLLHTRLADAFLWVVTLVFNPDGYQYTWTHDRMWRKNRQPLGAESRCVGVDMCRNGNAGFGGEGASDSPCAETYRGRAAHSSPEVEQVMSYVEHLTRTRSVFAYANVHAYSQLILTPYGYTKERSADHDAQVAFAGRIAARMYGKHQKRYRFGPAATTIYQASGIVSDTVYDDFGVVYSMAWELRDTGTRGFLLPPTQICEQADEVIEALREFRATAYPDAPAADAVPAAA